MCACRLTENEHKKRQKVQKEKDEIGENRERIGPKITEKVENNGKSASLVKHCVLQNTISVSSNNEEAELPSHTGMLVISCLCPSQTILIKWLILFV